MIEVKNLKNQQQSLKVPSKHNQTIDATGLTALPAIIDPHVHFRTPGHEHKENWVSGAKACKKGGVCAVFDMPNTSPPTISKELLKEKKQLIDSQLDQQDYPLTPYFYFGANETNQAEIDKVKDEVIGVKVYMGPSTGNLFVNDLGAIKETFLAAKESNLLVGVHAESFACLCQGRQKFEGQKIDASKHPEVRSRQAAIEATQNALDLALQTGAKVAILHVGTAQEVDLIAQAKKQSPKTIFAEVTPSHLFLDDSLYASLGNLIKMNPPVRSLSDQEVLWQGLLDGTIDWIGSDHAPHTLSEKELDYWKAPSGITGIETTLLLLLRAFLAGKITLEQIAHWTHHRVVEVFSLIGHEQDFLLLDFEKSMQLQQKDLATRAGQSPFVGQHFQGGLAYSVIGGEVIEGSV